MYCELSLPCRHCKDIARKRREKALSHAANGVVFDRAAAVRAGDDQIGPVLGYVVGEHHLRLAFHNYSLDGWRSRSGSLEVWFADGRESVRFYWDNLVSRRLSPKPLTRERAIIEKATALARAEMDKLDNPE